MKPLYGVNGLVHWSQREINMRERLVPFFAEEISDLLLSQNRAWQIERTEGPMMLPQAMVNPNYTTDDIWVFANNEAIPLVARPETTSSTYSWMVDRIQSHDGVKLPYACWQVGKSFRNEQDHVLSHMRLKEFYQMEFQCVYGADTMNDYQERSLEPIRHMIGMATRLPTRLVESDRLPSYSLRTMDVEVDTGSRWMEVCSISKRTDFPIKNRFQNKKKEWIENDIFVLEIALGMDRIVYASKIAEEAHD